MLTYLTEELPSTATHKVRSIAWVSNGTGFVDIERPGGELESIPAAGKLTIKLQFGRRAGGKVEVDTYAVAEVDSVQPGGRTFQLLNLTDPDPKGPFEVTITPILRWCGCEAGGYRTPTCKHRDAVAKLIELEVDFGYATPPVPVADDVPEWAKGAYSSDTSWLTEAV